MRLRLTRKSTEADHNSPSRLQQRWLLILSLAGAVTITLSVSGTPAVGIPVGIAIVGLLHAIID